MNPQNTIDSAPIDFQHMVYAIFQMRNKIDAIYFLLTKDLPKEEKDRYDLINELRFREDILFSVRPVAGQEPEFLIKLKAEVEEMKETLAKMNSQREEKE